MKPITLIPAAGAGTRMRPLTHSLPKAMLPVGGAPILNHIIDAAAEAGSEEFVIITEYKAEYIEENIPRDFPNLKFHFVRQGPMMGLGHACFKSRDLCDNKPLLIIYGDTLFEADLKSALESPIPNIGVFEVDDPRRFGIIEKNDSDKITRFIEKPDNPTTNLALPGVNYFPDSGPLFAALQHIIDNNIKTKNEYQITDAFQHMVAGGQEMTFFRLKAWYDCGKHFETLETNKALLDSQGTTLKGQVENCEITDPVYVAAGSVVKNCALGPHVSVGPGNTLEDCQLESSILGNDNQLTGVKLKNSMVGNKCQLKNMEGEMVLGDDTYFNIQQE